MRAQYLVTWHGTDQWELSILPTDQSRLVFTGYQEGGRDSCDGDSGGPLSVRLEDGRWYIVGVVSWGIGCGEVNQPGVMVRLSKYTQWIQSIISWLPHSYWKWNVNVIQSHKNQYNKFWCHALVYGNKQIWDIKYENIEQWQYSYWHCYLSHHMWHRSLLSQHCNVSWPGPVSGHISLVITQVSGVGDKNYSNSDNMNFTAVNSIFVTVLVLIVSSNNFVIGEETEIARERFKIILPSKTESCYFLPLKQSDKLSVRFLVISYKDGKQQDVTFRIKDPTSSRMVSYQARRGQA